MQDTRLGRFFAVDPLTKKYPFYTPYQFAGNTPIEARELEGLEPSHTAQKSPCEGCGSPCKEATLEDGDYFSDVQDQKYTTTFSGISESNFQAFKRTFTTDPGKAIDNDRAQYRLVDRDGSHGVSVSDHFDINIDWSPNGRVVVKSVIETQNSASIQVQTLQGHPDAGTNTFSITYDASTQTMIWQTHNVSRTNDNMGGIGAAFAGARGKQQEQWKDVARSIHKKLGSPKVESAIAVVNEFDYNDYTNKIGKKEVNQSFEEDFSKTFE
jgi:hypothetical protein